MKYTTFKETNLMLGAGDNPNTGDLPVSVSVHRENQGIPTFISCWKPTQEELDEINRTGVIWIGIMGMRMQPVSVMAYDPFKYSGFVPVELG